MQSINESYIHSVTSVMQRMSQPVSEGKTITTYELLEKSAQAALELQRSDGSFPPGQNGVYDEPETPVRTTSHWLTTLSKVYEITGDEELAEAANDAADYLLSDKARPHRYTFHSRNAKGKNKCDGLIGQAAPIRGLACAGPALNRPELLEASADVLSLHPFDSDLGIWEKVEIDGTLLSFDRTLNHQLTFAASCANLSDHGVGTNKIERFLDRITDTMRLHSNGLIKHYIRPPIFDALRTPFRSPRYRNLLLNEFMFHYYSRSFKYQLREIGYHPVNLRSLARLKESFPDHPVWKTTLINDATCFVDSDRYTGSKGVMDTDYGSMTPGIHTAYALLVLGNRDLAEVRDWVSIDIEQRFDFDQDLFVSNATDSYFQASTIYNLSLLPNISITF